VNEDLDAFGYRPAWGHQPISRYVAEGKNPNTLQPVVLVSFLFASSEVLTPDDEGRVAIAMSPKDADDLAAELTRWAVRAREKHWQ
jgi:hypothetical protein